MSKQKLIYISGKMGEKRLSKATIKKFEAAQEKLANDGWAVINPGWESIPNRSPATCQD